MACTHWPSTYPNNFRPDKAQLHPFLQKYNPSFRFPREIVTRNKQKKKAMAQAMASMTGLLDGTCSSRLLSGKRVLTGRAGFIVRAQQTPVESETVAQTSRRAALGLIAAGLTGGTFAKAVFAEARSIKIGPPPPPSGGLSKHYQICVLILLN
jgi:Oxygen evolving enhancer protein 3 (PsbQ)